MIVRLAIRGRGRTRISLEVEPRASQFVGLPIAEKGAPEARFGRLDTLRFPNGRRQA